MHIFNVVHERVRLAQMSPEQLKAEGRPKKRPDHKPTLTQNESVSWNLAGSRHNGISCITVNRKLTPSGALHLTDGQQRGKRRLGWHAETKVRGAIARSVLRPTQHQLSEDLHGQCVLTPRGSIAISPTTGWQWLLIMVMDAALNLNAELAEELLLLQAKHEHG